MRIKTAVHAMYHLKLLKDGLTREQGAKYFDCSWQFLLSVLTHKRPMPFWLVDKLAEFLDVDKNVIAVAFGYYPNEWINLCREKPDLVFRAMKSITETIKVENKKGISESRGKVMVKTMPVLKRTYLTK